MVFYVAKVGLLDTFLVLYQKTLNFPYFFEKLVPQNNYFFVNANLFGIITSTAIKHKQYNGEEEEQQVALA